MPVAGGGGYNYTTTFWGGMNSDDEEEVIENDGGDGGFAEYKTLDDMRTPAPDGLFCFFSTSICIEVLCFVFDFHASIAHLILQR